MASPFYLVQTTTIMEVHGMYSYVAMGDQLQYRWMDACVLTIYTG